MRKVYREGQPYIHEEDHLAALEAAMKEKEDLLIAERAVSQCLREDFNEARKQYGSIITSANLHYPLDNSDPKKEMEVIRTLNQTKTEYSDAQRRADFGPNGDATTPGFFIKTKTEVRG